MKRKQIFILIGLLVIILIGLLLFWLLGREAKLNSKHIGINFEIHNCSPVEKNKENLRLFFLQPLLSSNVVEEKSGLDRLFIPQIACDETIFSIPTFGINVFRYDGNAQNIKETSLTITSRVADEENFYNSWQADGFESLEKSLLKGNVKEDNLPTLSDLMLPDASDDIIQDSVIIDKNCKSEIFPYVFKSAENVRKYMNKVLEKNPDAILEGTENNTIHIFIYCGTEQYLLNKNDKDNDGIDNQFDLCPDLPGEKSNNGCPIKEDSDKDGVYDENDACPTEKGEKACDGCPCPPPIVQPDDDKDGIPNSKDKCPKEFGFRKYNGCPVPDSDGDGLNDEIDKCPEEKGPKSNDGCPVMIRITHNNADGTFTVNGISNINDYNVIMYITESNGRVVEHKFTGYVSPYPNEAKKLTKLIGDPVETSVRVVVYDKSNKEIKSTTFNGLSMICFSDGDCGFVDLNKN